MNEPLNAARKARTDKVLNRRTRDRLTGEEYTIRQRLDKGEYAYRTVHVEAGKRDTYGFILATEPDASAPTYMTCVVSTTKLAYDYASQLPALEFDEDRQTVTPIISDAEWAHLTGQDNK